MFCGLALLWAIVDVVRAGDDRLRALVYLVLVLATWILGFVDALVHAKDAWASMPEGLILSMIVTVLACAATWVGFARLGRGGAR